MKLLLKAKTFALVLSLAAMVLLPGVMGAQTSGDDQPTVTLQTVKERLAQNKGYIENARQRGRAGDAAGVETALENYSRSMTGLDRALSQGQFEGTESQNIEALERVDKATSKHGKVLTDLLTKVPEQAKPAIERALEASQRGRTTALANLEKAQARRAAAAANRPDSAGPPSGFGKPSTVGGPPSGVGRPATAGPPASRPGRPR